jgi:hypothetical protein
MRMITRSPAARRVLQPSIPIGGVRGRARVVDLAARRTRTAALFVITCDVGADRSAGAQLRSLVGTRSTTHFCADRRQARTCRNALITERLGTTLDVVHSHCMPVHGIHSLPLPLSLTGVAAEHSAVVPAGESQRRTQRRRRNQTGGSGEDQASDRSKSGEQHVDTASCPSLFERVGGKWTPPGIADRSIVGTSGPRFLTRLPTGLSFNLLCCATGVEPKSVRSS